MRRLLSPVVVLAAAAGVSGIFSVAAQAQTDVLGAAAAYNLFTFGDASNQNTDVAGKVAIGGSGAFSSFTFFNDNQNNQSVNHTPVVVVGDSLTYNNGSAWGSIVAGGSVTTSGTAIYGDLSARGTISATNGTVYGTQDHAGNLPFSFSSYQQTLTSQSAYLSGLAVNTSYSGGTYSFVGSASNHLGIIGLTGSDFASANSLSIDAPADATVVINVSGMDITTPNQQNFVTTSGGIPLSHVLLNFGDATTINLKSLNASILAPGATVNATYSQYNGSLIANKFNGGGIELHDNNLFNGTVPNVPRGVPEPPELLLTVMGTLGMLAGLSARCRRGA